MVEPPLALPQVQVEGRRGHAVELPESMPGGATEALDAVEMALGRPCRRT